MGADVFRQGALANAMMTLAPLMPANAMALLSKLR
jgi:hypothetical protein